MFMGLVKKRIEKEEKEEKEQTEYKIKNEKINKTELIKLNVLYDLIQSYENKNKTNNEFHDIIKIIDEEIQKKKIEKIKIYITEAMILNTNTNVDIFHEEFEDLIEKSFNQDKDENKIKFMYFMYYLQNVTLDKLFKKT